MSIEEIIKKWEREKKLAEKYQTMKKEGPKIQLQYLNEYVNLVDKFLADLEKINNVK